MASINKVILLGRLGADPELRHTKTSQAVCQLSVATNRVWTDGGGQKREEVTWHRVVVWGKQAEHCREYLSKGRQLYVEGRLRHDSYVDQSGVKRFTTEVVANTVQFLPQSRPAVQASIHDGPPSESVDDRLPF